MAEGLKTPPLTQLEFSQRDHKDAERMARALGFEQFAYTSTSGLWGLFCLPENPAHTFNLTCVTRKHPPFVHGCIIKTREFGLMFVQTMEDLGL